MGSSTINDGDTQVRVGSNDEMNANFDNSSLYSNKTLKMMACKMVLTG